MINQSNREGLSFVALGVGDAFSAEHYSSTIAAYAEGQWLLVDCPHPLRKILRESGTAAGHALDIPDLCGTVVTHLHADHSSGLEGLGYFHRFVLGSRARLVAHPSVVARLWEGHLAAGMECLIDAHDHHPHTESFTDYFDVADLDTTRAVHVGPFAIECCHTIHHVPTTALRITAAGRTLGFSADTAFDPSLIAWLAESDRFVHETNYGAHTPYEKLAALPEDIRRRMWLIHYPDGFDTAGANIECLVQGRRYEV